MTRVPVPDDFEGNHIVVAGTRDHQHGTRDSDIDVDDRRHARNLHVREDGEGRYVGVGDNLADAVRSYFGVTDTGSDDDNTSEADSDAQPDTVTLDNGCPWCDEYDGDAVGQHASSAHPDEWTAYKEANG